MTHSAPSTNASDRSRLTSITDRSSSLHHQTPSRIQLKNPLNQHLQRIRGSRNDVEFVGSLRRLQQWNLIADSGSSATVRLETADVFDKEISNGFRKNEFGYKSSNLNCATVGECSLPKSPTSHDYDGRKYGYRNGISGSTNRNNQCIDCNTNNNVDDINLERNISVKITVGTEVPEKSVHLFSENVTNSVDDDKVISLCTSIAFL